MKNVYNIIGLILLLTLTACPSKKYQPSIKLLDKNHMDFPYLKEHYYHTIKFKLSTLFQSDFNPKHVLKNFSFSKKIPDLAIYFSIESFSKKEAKEFQFEFNDDTDLLNAVNDNYMIKRQESLYNPYTSIKKNVPKTVKYPGYIQAIEGSTLENGIKSAYFTATLMVDNKFYVFQLIGLKENMGYFYDDFLHILSSVEKKS